MPDQSDPQFGLPCLLVRLTERDDVGLIEHRNQGLSNGVNPAGFVG